jgi:Uncharacterised nucleotidyltransferase
MNKPITQAPSERSMILLSRLLWPRSMGDQDSASEREEFGQQLASLSRDQFNELVDLSKSNHVTVRGLEVFLRLMREAPNATRCQWAEDALAAERARIATAVAFLGEICEAFADHGYNVAVIKSLDHWPDLGSDLDLYTDADRGEVFELIRSRFHARIAPRSWSDRLAAKWNFFLPGLREAVEVHMGRLGQTGEQVTIASSLLGRSKIATACGRPFRIPSVSDRVLISTLQRMYRHFFFRLCDILDSAALIELGAIDYEDLRERASTAGIWEGVATYLAIVSDYVKKYRGVGFELPKFVTKAARFGADLIYYGNGFLRVPIIPQSAGLYGLQLAGALGKGELHHGIRLSLLPWLATAAVVGFKLTGSDKGIW